MGQSFSLGDLSTPTMRRSVSSCAGRTRLTRAWLSPVSSTSVLRPSSGSGTRRTPEPTEVELTFAARGPTLTRASVEHRGWEALTEEQLREDCAAPGGYSSGAYSKGWADVLATFAATIGTERPAHEHKEAWS